MTYRIDARAGLARRLFLVRWLVVGMVAGIVGGASGCGRSGFEEDLFGPDAGLGIGPDGAPIVDASPDARRDAGPDGDSIIRPPPPPPPACNATTCPRGCCAAGVCQTGDVDALCGGFGQECTDCIAEGFERCDPLNKACTRRPARTCGPQNCGGCCETFGGVAECLTGRDPNACGAGGERCQQCVNTGLTCDQRTRECVSPPVCNASTCSGCCQNGVCVLGTQTATCGTRGQQCQNCASTGGQCESLGQGAGGVCRGRPTTCGPQTCAGCCQAGACVAGTQTQACGTGGAACTSCGPNGTCRPGPNGRGGVCQGTPPPTCNPATCNGCCVNGACVAGTQDATCGTGGRACANCTSSRQVCRAGACATPPPPACGPESCSGCCDGAGRCQGGFVARQCGSQGNACADCTARNSTCDTSATPRVCRTNATVCPASYTTCPSTTTTPVPAVQNICPQTTLRGAALACAAGPDSVPCRAFFQLAAAQNPACATCLRPFNVPLTEGKGILRCLAPFVSATCNRATGCAADCQEKSCAGCNAAEEARCQQEVRQTQCQSFIQQSACVTPAFLGQGAFCNPLSYGNNFGAWLSAVGDHFCGQ